MTSYRQTIKEVHQNDDNEEDKSEEEDVAEGGVEGDVRELKLADEHGEGLHQAKAKVVKEGIVSLSTPVVFMKEDVEAKAEGKEEQRVPNKEGGEGLEDPVEHGGVDVIRREPRMPAHHRNQLYPEKGELEEKECYAERKVVLLTMR